MAGSRELGRKPGSGRREGYNNANCFVKSYFFFFTGKSGLLGGLFVYYRSTAVRYFTCVFAGSFPSSVVSPGSNLLL